MGTVRFSRRARGDLLKIWAYIAQTNPSAADRVIDLIESRCALLAAHPHLGPARPEIAADARVLIVQRWLALYKLIDGGVQIVSILDSARDQSKLRWAP